MTTEEVIERVKKIKVKNQDLLYHHEKTLEDALDEFQREKTEVVFITPRIFTVLFHGKGQAETDEFTDQMMEVVKEAENNDLECRFKPVFYGPDPATGSFVFIYVVVVAHNIIDKCLFEKIDIYFRMMPPSATMARMMMLGGKRM